MTHYPIEPVTITYGSTSYTATRLYAQINYQVGSAPMFCPWSLTNDDDGIIWSGTAEITEEQIDNWGTDNMYIVNIIAEQAGVVITGEAVDASMNTSGSY